MHVALVAPAWPPEGAANGIVTYVSAMRAELTERGHRVSVFSPAVESPAPGVHRIPSNAGARMAAEWTARFRRWGGVFAFGRAIAASVRGVHARDPIDVIEMEESFGWVGDVATRLDIPVVCKLHGPAFLSMVAEELETEFGREKVRREGVALARLRVVLSPSRYTLRETLARYQLRPALAEQVVNPLDLARDAVLWDIQSCERDTVLFVGRFDRIKGGDLAILAFQQLRALRPGLRLVFAGPDPGLQGAEGARVHLRDFVASLNDPSLPGAITCTGPLDPGRIRVLRSSAAVTVVPSRRESQGYTALEALLQACPVVCTDTSGLGEIVEHGVTGLKARPEDVGDIAAQMHRILENPSLAGSLGRAGRAYVLKHHAPAAVVAQTLDVYRRAIALHHSGVAA